MNLWNRLCEKYNYETGLIERFKECIKSISYQNHGILPMEAFALCKYIEDNEITVVLESGTAHGYSTEILGRMFPNIKITTVDWLENYGKESQNATQKRLSYLDNISFIIGDSRKEFPKLIKIFNEEKIAVFIDGPKKERATTLAMDCLKYDNVVFSSCHDQKIQGKGRYSPNLDTEFSERYKFLNNEVNTIIHPDYESKTLGEQYPNGMGITFFLS